MSKPFKKAGFAMGLRGTTTTKKEGIGTLRITQDGRKFRYARNGAVALAVGNTLSGAAIAANVMNQAMPAAVAVGKKTSGYTAGGAVTYAQDYFAEGSLMINDAAGEGYAYQLIGSSAVAAGTAITLQLDEGIRVALTTSSEGTLCHNPWMAVITQATEESFPAGVSMGVVAISAYCWVQTGGLAIVLHADTAAVGSMITHGATNGSAAVVVTPFDIDEPIIGVQYGTAGVTGEYKPVFLTID
jgi:hypothetical protein